MHTKLFGGRALPGPAGKLNLNSSRENFEDCQDVRGEEKRGEAGRERKWVGHGKGKAEREVRDGGEWEGSIELGKGEGWRGSSSICWAGDPPMSTSPIRLQRCYKLRTRTCFTCCHHIVSVLLTGKVIRQFVLSIYLCMIRLLDVVACETVVIVRFIYVVLSVFLFEFSIDYALSYWIIVHWRVLMITSILHVVARF